MPKVKPLAAAAPLTSLMMRNGEIALASWQTLLHRTMMMSGANVAALTAAERQEFSRMYTEKTQTAMECIQVMTREMIHFNQQFTIMAWSQLMTSGMAMASMNPGRNLADPLTAHGRIANAAAQCTGEAMQKMSAAVARAMTRSLKPVHTRVTANAKRLGRSRRQNS